MHIHYAKPVKTKIQDERCDKCKTIYNCAKTNASKNKKSSVVNKLPSNDNKAINCTNSQSNKTDFGINEGNSGVGGSDSSGVDSFILVDDINGFGNKQNSKYAHLFCRPCQSKSTKNISPDCKKIHDRARQNACYARKKMNNSVKTIDINNQTEVVQSNTHNQSDPIKPENSVNDVTELSQKSLANHRSRFKKLIIKTPNRTAQFNVDFLNKMPADIRERAVKKLKFDSDQNAEDNLIKNVVQDIKEEFGAKSPITYTVMSKLGDAKYLQKRTKSNLQTIFKVNWTNAGKLKSRTKLVRKKYKTKITGEIIDKIENYYLSDDISRLDTSQKNASKKYGPRRYMTYAVQDAYVMFINENPEIKVSFTKFYMLKPKNVKYASQTPLLSSLCPYCMNIRLKLQKLNIPDLKMEYHLFNELLCKTAHKVIIENADCISKKCAKCNDWESQIETLLSKVPNQDKNITWYTWQKSEVKRKNGKIGYQRDIVCKTRPFTDFKKELIEDVLHPTQRSSFIEHYMTQKFQYKTYKDCLAYLKPGQFIMVQDFAKNRDIINQDEIKASYWIKHQVTMHPTVIFYRLIENGPINILVVTHLSDITNHDAHLVHYMTLECIEILQKKYPTVKWTKAFLWSDGCAAQYKGKNSFYYLDKFPLDVERNFFASEHGKGPSDAETGLISMKLNKAIKSRKVVIQNASDMYNFLKIDNKKDNEGHDDNNIKKREVERIFKLVEKDDLQPLMEKFKGVTVSTLSGNCTRSLHQIKPTKTPGVLLQRPFSCFCSRCRAGEFSDCTNYGFTKGEFIRKELKTLDTNEVEIENEEEFEDETNVDLIIDENDLLDDEEINIEYENIQFDDLKENSFVVVAVPVEYKKKNKQQTVSFHVAKIIELVKGEKDITIHYFKQDKFNHEKFLHDSKEIDFSYVTDLDNIIMLLPEPQPTRSGVVFPTKIKLNIE